MAHGDIGRPIQIDGMAYAPTNEQGTVFLFGRLSSRMGIQVEEMNTRFPDCIGWYRGKRVRIEIEYRASEYAAHRHPPRGADVSGCLENDWEHRPKAYQRLQIIDLKRFVGALPRVFMVGCDEGVRGDIPEHYKRIHWSVPGKAQVKDLIVLYRKAPASEIRDLWKVVGDFTVDKKWGIEADLHRVVHLSKPLSCAQLKSDPHTRQLGMVRQNFEGKRDITDEWGLLYEKIVSQNPSARVALREYAPH